MRPERSYIVQRFVSSWLVPLFCRKEVARLEGNQDAHRRFDAFTCGKWLVFPTNNISHDTSVELLRAAASVKFHIVHSSIRGNAKTRYRRAHIFFILAQTVFRLLKFGLRDERHFALPPHFRDLRFGQ